MVFKFNLLLIFKILRFYNKLCFYLPRRNSPPVVQGPLFIEDSRSHSDIPHSVGLLWTSDQLVVETSTLQHTTLTGDETSLHRRGFEPILPASKQPQTHALDRAATEFSTNSV